MRALSRLGSHLRSLQRQNLRAGWCRPSMLETAMSLIADDGLLPYSHCHDAFYSSSTLPQWFGILRSAKRASLSAAFARREHFSSLRHALRHEMTALSSKARNRMHAWAQPHVSSAARSSYALGPPAHAVSRPADARPPAMPGGVLAMLCSLRESRDVLGVHRWNSASTSD